MKPLNQDDLLTLALDALFYEFKSKNKLKRRVTQVGDISAGLSYSVIKMLFKRL